MNSHWIESLREFLSDKQPVVMITVAKVEGSAPRESTCRMFVFKDRCVATIGGGNLEYQAISLARKILSNESKDDYRLELYGLGPALQQCCGGVVTLAFEKFIKEPDWLTDCEVALDEPGAILQTKYDHTKGVRKIITGMTFDSFESDDTVLIEALGELNPEVVVFGAGHVGSALVDVLSRLPFKVSWIDERDSLFPAVLETGINKYSGLSPLQQIDNLPDCALNIVMTHSHGLDEEICFKYLKEKDFYFLGLIGSKTKRARFLHRLRDRGIDQKQLGKLVCPIGIAEVTGSSPPEIAISVAAQLLNLRDNIKHNSRLS